MSRQDTIEVMELASLIKDNLSCKHLVLSVEEALVNFLQDDRSPDGVLELQPMSPYHRLLLHRLADIYGFAHESVGEGDDRHLVLERCPDTAIPSILVSDILWHDEFPSSTTSPYILRRKEDSVLKKNETLPSSTSYEEREAAYLAARERIFSLHENDEKEVAALMYAAYYISQPVSCSNSSPSDSSPSTSISTTRPQPPDAKSKTTPHHQNPPLTPPNLQPQKSVKTLPPFTSLHSISSTNLHSQMAALSLLLPSSSSSLKSLRFSRHPLPIHRRIHGIRCQSAPISTALTQDDLKKLAAVKAVEYVKSDMVLGLGTGSTAAFVVAEIGALLSAGKLTGIVGVPTSTRTFEQAKSLGIPLSTLDAHPKIDLAIDGADEVDPDLNLVKGRGGALLREKMVEAASDKFVVVADDTKLVTGLGGSGLAMPVEVVQFCWKYNLTRLQELFNEEGCDAQLRLDGDGKPYVTDNSNYIVDLYFKTPIKDANAAGNEISALEGVVEHGLFLDMATAVIIAGKDGVSVQTK